MSERSLTDGEIALARGIYRDSIEYAVVHVHDRGYAFFHKTSGMAPNGNIYLPGCHHPDFAEASVPEQRLFIHEMLHVWQYQNKVLHLAGAAIGLGIKHLFNYAKTYQFRLKANTDLTDYGMEQQAAIIEEYFLRKHGLTWGRCLNTENDTQLLLEGVLKNFLENPSYARRKIPPFPLQRRGGVFCP